MGDKSEKQRIRTNILHMMTANFEVIIRKEMQYENADFKWIDTYCGVYILDELVAHFDIKDIVRGLTDLRLS